jgi:hypothetical protein
MTGAHDEIRTSIVMRNRTTPLRAAGWFACVGGLAIPLALWTIMVTSMMLLGPDSGLRVRVIAESFLTMVWVTSVVLIAPGVSLGVIAGLLVINMVIWGGIGYLSQRVMSRPLVYYGLLGMVVLGFLLSNGSFIWVAIEGSKLPFDLINIPTFCVAAAALAVIFVARRRRVPGHTEAHCG